MAEVLPASLRRALRKARNRLGDHPVFLPLVMALTPQRLSRALTSDTELVVEGFPRCGNTFAVAAIALAQDRAVVISSHVHVPAQVKLAVRRGLPTLVVIRRPVDAVASLIVAAPHVPPAAALLEFAHHYDELLRWRQGVVVATFDEVTRDMGVVIDRVNGRFGTSFGRFEHTKENVAEAFRYVDSRFESVHGHRPRALPRPAQDRAAARDRARMRVEDPAVAQARETAESVYRRFTT